jgi:hypothetical protein
MPRRNPAPAVQFGKILVEHAKTRRPEVSLWDISKELGCETGLMARVTQGKRRLPVKYLEPLADALRLKGKERTDFIRSGLRAFLGDDYEIIARMM